MSTNSSTCLKSVEKEGVARGEEALMAAPTGGVVKRPHRQTARRGHNNTGTGRRGAETDGTESDASTSTRSSIVGTANPRRGSAKKRTASRGSEGAKRIAGADRGEDTDGPLSEASGMDIDVGGDPTARYSRSSKANLPSIEDIKEGMAGESLGSLQSRVMECARRVEFVTTNSANLKGTFVKELRLAAVNTRAAIEVMAHRTGGPGDGSAEALQRENAQLRTQIADLRREVHNLNIMVTSSRTGMGEDRILRQHAGGSRASPPTGATGSSAGEDRIHRQQAGGSRASPPASSTRTVVFRDEARRGPVPETKKGGLLMEIERLIDRKMDGLRKELRLVRPKSTGRRPPGPLHLGSGRSTAVSSGAETESAPPHGPIKFRSSSYPIPFPIPSRKSVQGGGPVRSPARSAESPSGAEPKWTEVVRRKPRRQRPEADVTAAAKRTEAATAARKPGPATAARKLGPATAARKPGPGPAATAARTTGPATTAARTTGPATTAARTTRTRTGAATKRGPAPAAAQRKPPSRVRAAKTAAVTLTMPPECGVTYAQALTMAKSKIALADLGIEGVKPRRSQTGGLVLEVAGPGRVEKAETLASRMREALAGTGARIARPSKRTDLRLRGLDDSATQEEVRRALSQAGGCPADDVRVGEIRRSPNGLGTVWAQCPTEAARKLPPTGRLLIGWTATTVEALKQRPLQCYKCLYMGHVRMRCPHEVDRSAACYRCGAEGHRAGACTQPLRCPLCRDLGRPANHRLGSRTCAAVRGQKPRASPATPAAGDSGTAATPATDGSPAATKAEGTTAVVPMEVESAAPVAACGSEGAEKVPRS